MQKEKKCFTPLIQQWVLLENAHLSAMVKHAMDFVQSVIDHLTVNCAGYGSTFACFGQGNPLEFSRHMVSTNFWS